MCDAGSGTIRLRGTDHVDPPHVTTNHRHDVAHVGAIHDDAVPIVFERVEHNQEKVDPLLDRVVLSFVFPKSPSVFLPDT